MLLRANFSKAILCKPGLGALQSLMVNIDQSSGSTTILIIFNLCNHFKWQRLDDISSLRTRYSPAACTEHLFYFTGSQQSCNCVQVFTVSLLHYIYWYVTIVTSLLQCDTGLGQGTADHGVPDEVRRHLHHLPLPGLVTLHRRQQVEDMLCF